jgi:hypothetical protein
MAAILFSLSPGVSSGLWTFTVLLLMLSSMLFAHCYFKDMRRLVVLFPFVLFDLSN